MEEFGAQSKKSRRTRKITNEQLIAEHGKIPPQALDYEEAVIGAMMVEKDALTEVIDILKPDSFYKDAHQKIYSAIQGLFQRSEPIDLLTVKTALEKEGHLELVGGPAYIAKLTSRIASAANIEEHARVIAQKYIQRELIRISSEIIKDSFDETSDVFDILDHAEQKLFQVAYNINPQDKRYEELSKKYHKMDNVTNWEKRKFENIKVDTVLFKFNNSSKNELEGLKDVYALLNYEPDKKKSFWSKLFSFETKKDKKKNKKTASLSNTSSYEIKDKRFESVVVVKTNSGLGTGFFISEDEILTNYHVIEEAMTISVVNQNKKRSSAVVLKSDMKRDLALLKTNMKGTPVKFYTDQLKQGEMVEALGHPKGRKFSLTKGWISAIRKWDSVYSATGTKDVLFIQTDAAINSGNSGGPLFYKDKVVGVNTQKMVDTDIEGMNFAVHFSEVNQFLSR